MKFCILIPAHNEKDSLEPTVRNIRRAFDRAGLEHHVLIVNDNSSDGTRDVAEQLVKGDLRVSVFHRAPPAGVGLAIRDGLSRMVGDAVIIAMADASDDPEDMIVYAKKLEDGYDCVFGSRFIKGSRVENYPFHKLILNRLANRFIQVMFLTRFNDITNAFKAYRREVIEAVQPLVSKRFNITVEIPLKALIRGRRISSVPIRWYGRTIGTSKLIIKEMGSRYLFVLFYVWLEKHLLKGDY
ncbi:MAG: glycosyltransferase family 2 protein [Elusimicrobiota bacterium]